MKSQVLTAIYCFYLILDIALKVNILVVGKLLVGQILVAHSEHITSLIIEVVTMWLLIWGALASQFVLFVHNNPSYIILSQASCRGLICFQHIYFLVKKYSLYLRMCIFCRTFAPAFSEGKQVRVLHRPAAVICNIVCSESKSLPIRWEGWTNEQ